MHLTRSLLPRPRRLLAAGALAVSLPALAQCAPTVAGTTDPVRAACRILYSDWDVGDQYTQLGGCIVPRNPSAPNSRKRLCRDSLNAAWGINPSHVTLCDYPMG
jgi:hypothetical protein